MEERKAPDRTERIEQREIDPSAYSLSSSAKMIDESFEETNEIQSWTGGNTDFSDLDDDEMNRFLFHETDLNSDNDEE